MKTSRIITALAIAVFAVSAFSCKKQSTMIFGDQSGVYPDISEYIYSFLEYPGRTEDVITCPINLFGRVAGHDRVIKAEIAPDTLKRINTADPSWYEILDGVMPADSVKGSLRIRLKYNEMLEDSIYMFYVRMAPSEDFPNIDYRSTDVIKVQLTAKEVQPANWNGFLRVFWGSYSTRWWKFIKEATGRTSIPYWPGNSDKETWWMSDDEFLSLNTLVKRALRNYNELNPDEPLTHDDGVDKGKPVPMPS